MNAIQQISLKLQLGIDPSIPIQSEQLLQKWQVFNTRRCRERAMRRMLDQQASGSVGSKSGVPSKDALSKPDTC